MIIWFIERTGTVMEYMSCPEAAKKWGISERRVQILCKEDRIPGVSKIGYMWLIPKDAEKPVDARRSLSMSNLLLLEDDISLIDGLHYSLKKNGFYVDIARTVEEAEKQLAQIEKYDLLILDVTLPDGTGFEVCENVRKHNKQIPIIFLTASDEEVNIIRGLDCGGDDYVTKPFKLGELCSRIRALLRRAGVTPQDKASVLKCGDISIDFLSCRVILNNKILELTNAEYRLLCLLVRNANRIVSRDIILNDLWDGTGNFVDDNTLSVYIRRLREKVETDASHPQRLITIRGFGYQWKEV